MRAAFALATSLAASALLAGAASPAGPPGAASGTDDLDSLTVTSSIQADGNTILEGDETGHTTGTVTTTYVGHFRDIIHPDGSFEFKVSGVDTGTTPCGSGEMPFRAVLSGTPTAFTGIHEGIDNAQNTANTGTNFKFVGSGTHLTYTGTYRCLS